MKKAGVRLWLVTMLAIGVALVSYRYVLPGMPGASPAVVANHLNRHGSLVVHAGLAATALILGALQFFPGIRRRWPAWHRRAGTRETSSATSAG